MRGSQRIGISSPLFPASTILPICPSGNPLFRLIIHAFVIKTRRIGMNTGQHRRRLSHWRSVSNFGKTDSAISLLSGWALHQTQTFKQRARFLKLNSSKRFSRRRSDSNSYPFRQMGFKPPRVRRISGCSLAA